MMVRLKADFEADWIAHLRTHMTTVWGAQVSALDDRHVPVYFFETLARKIIVKSRVLKVADDFYCPPDAAAGWDILRDKVLRGDNLNSHLSTRHASLSNRDGLLAEWNVHHLHLGTNSHHANPFYVSRTHRLVFALIDNRTFHAIGVYEHGHWEETSIIERIHRN